MMGSIRSLLKIYRAFSFSRAGLFLGPMIRALGCPTILKFDDRIKLAISEVGFFNFMTEVRHLF